MLKMDLISENKRKYAYIERVAQNNYAHSDRFEDKLKMAVVYSLILPWIKGNKWMGGMSDKQRSGIYRHLMLCGFEFEDIERVEQEWMDEVALLDV